MTMIKIMNEQTVIGKKYNSIILAMMENGTTFKKKHGYWLRSPFIGGYLLLDSWNGYIYFHKNICESRGQDVSGNEVCFDGYTGAVASYLNFKYKKGSMYDELEKYFHLI